MRFAFVFSAAGLCVLPSLACPQAARADGTPSVLEVDLAAEGSYLGVPEGTQAGPGAGISAVMAVSPRWSAGISLSTGAFLNAEPALAPTTGSVPSAQTVGGLTRADLEGRNHLLLNRWVDLWGGADAGLAFASYQDPGGSAVGPHAGLAGGADFHPLRFLSLGLSLRAGGLLIDLLGEGTRVVPTATAGLVLGVHYGFGGD